MSDKFYPGIDTPDNYEKRVRLRVEGMPFVDALPILYSHLPENLELRIKIGNPADLNAFFTQLNDKWLEAGGLAMATQAMQQFSSSSQNVLQKNEALDNWLVLAKDLGYSGTSKDPTALKEYVYDNLTNRLGYKAAYIRKSPFAEPQVRKTYATKKVVRKVVPKVPAKVTRHCSACGKVGHTKVSCPRFKRTKKVNFAYQTVVEDPEDPEEEYIVEEEEVAEEEEDPDTEVEDDEEYIDEYDEEPRNCYAVKKK